MSKEQTQHTYYCTRCRLAKKFGVPKKTREELHFIFNTDLEVKVHLKTVHGIDNPREDTIDDYSVAIGISLPSHTAKKLQKKGSPFNIERARYDPR